MALCKSATELREKLLQQQAVQDQRARASIQIEDNALAQLLITHHLCLGQMSLRHSIEQNASFALPFFEALFRVTVRVSVKKLETASRIANWNHRHDNDVAYLLNHIYSKARD
eukprot:3083834-Amphidinium_carterae.1